MGAFALSGFLRRQPSGNVSVTGLPFQKNRRLCFSSSIRNTSLILKKIY